MFAGFPLVTVAVVSLSIPTNGFFVVTTATLFENGALAASVILTALELLLRFEGHTRHNVRAFVLGALLLPDFYAILVGILKVI